MFWDILASATNNDKCGNTDEEKENFLLINKIALWDIFKSGYRNKNEKRGISSDKAINFDDARAPLPTQNEIWENLQNIEAIIINGKTDAFKWFTKYNNVVYSSKLYDKDIDTDYYIWNKKIKVYPLKQTKSIENYNDTIEKEKWINLLKKLLYGNDNSKPKKFIIKKK